ncbi:GNAT family N-acetyltransferase [Treponema sp. OttesenSCG-928-L16]|nr:GNAT family N-acetyltransferase [Treponema sp. OttesenSCG-928-L16]
MDFTIEELSMNAWPALQTLLYDGWVIRFADGYGNRSNSVNPIYPSKIDVEQKLNYCDSLFMRHGLPAAYKLAGCKEHLKLDKRLDELKYGQINITSVQVHNELRILEKGWGGIKIKNHFDDDWMEGVIGLNKIKEAHRPIFKTIIRNICTEKIVVQKETEDGIVGCGYGAIDNNYVGIFDVVVKESERGKGYGREIVTAILSEGRKRGIEKSYLQVMENNCIAKKLYEKLGFKEVYKYWYRKKPV